MKNFCFVILHYENYEDTFECVDSILKNVIYTNYTIVIVDNGSSNKSGSIIQQKYQDCEKVTVIINKKNLGFARGNNVGFQYAKYTLKADFIALINNDTIISQPDFIEIILKKHKAYSFDILGPDIISLIDGHHQNPRPITLQNKEILAKLLIWYRIYLFLNYIGMDKILENFKKRLFKKPLINQEIMYTSNPDNREMVNVKLHGSCLIFSRSYIEKYDGLNPNTFMYSEEAILYFLIQRDRLKTIYTPDVKIYHKEDSSTSYKYKSNVQRRRFYYKNFIKSGQVLLQMMREKEQLP